MEDGFANSVASTNVTDLTRTISLEDHRVIIKAVFTIVGIMFMVFSTCAVIALNKTKHTPKTARFLSSGLIMYDVLAVSCYTIRKFIGHPELNIIIQIVGSGFAFLAYITVGIMSFERFIIFYSPNVYLRNITPAKLRNCVTIGWLTMLITYYFIRFGLCYFVHTDVTLQDVIGKCNEGSFLFYGVFIFVVVLISAACYTKIFLIVKSEIHNTNKSYMLGAAAKYIQNYKSTSLVLVYLLTISITSIAYAVIFLLGLETVPFRLAIDVVNMLNCMLDPCMYVLWYRECRMEILKMLSVCMPSLNSDIEHIRITIYQIVTVENIRSKKVYPVNSDRNT